MNDYLNPDWSVGGNVHNWKNHIMDEVRDIWDTFTDIQKLALYKQAEEQASNEEWE